MIMWNKLGISGGTAIVILIALYFVIKWAVKNGIKEAYSAITGKKKKTDEDVRNEKELKELGFELEDK
jgi:ABC-type protease/lipase transport system fused ATPase/permease subunit